MQSNYVRQRGGYPRRLSGRHDGILRAAYLRSRLCFREITQAAVSASRAGSRPRPVFLLSGRELGLPLHGECSPSTRRMAEGCVSGS